jgi:hypothetical protein
VSTGTTKDAGKRSTRLYESRDGGTGFTDSPNKSKPAEEISGRKGERQRSPTRYQKAVRSGVMNFAERGKDGCRNA